MGLKSWVASQFWRSKAPEPAPEPAPDPKWYLAAYCLDNVNENGPYYYEQTMTMLFNAYNYVERGQDGSDYLRSDFSFLNLLDTLSKDIAQGYRQYTPDQQEMAIKLLNAVTREAAIESYNETQRRYDESCQQVY